MASHPLSTLTDVANSTGVRFPIEECGLFSLESRRQASSFRRASIKSKNLSVQTFVSKLAVEVFDVSVLGRSPWLNEVESNAAAVAAGVHRLGEELGSVVHGDLFRQTALDTDALKGHGYLAPREVAVGVEREGFSGEDGDDR